MTPSRSSISRWFHLVLDLILVAAIVVAGAVAITFSCGRESRGAHPYWLGGVLAENVLALLVRHRHPTAALAGILAAYIVTDALVVALLPIALALADVPTQVVNG